MGQVVRVEGDKLVMVRSKGKVEMIRWDRTEDGGWKFTWGKNGELYAGNGFGFEEVVGMLEEEF